MNASFVAFAIILISCHVVVQGKKNVLDGDLKPFLEKFKKIMKTGDPKRGIPRLEPYEAVDEYFRFDLSYIKTDVNLKNLIVTGLSDYKVVNGWWKIVGLNVVVSLDFHKIVTDGDYSLNGTIADKYPIYGKGHVLGTLTELHVEAALQLGIRNLKLYTRNAACKVALQKLDLDMTGIFDDEETSKEISKIASANAPELIQKYQKQAAVTMCEIVKKKADQIVNNMTLEDMIELINS